MTTVPVAERCSMCEEPDGIYAEYRCLECRALICGGHADEHQMAAHASPEERAYAPAAVIRRAAEHWEEWRGRMALSAEEAQALDAGFDELRRAAGMEVRR